MSVGGKHCLTLGHFVVLSCWKRTHPTSFAGHSSEAWVSTYVTYVKARIYTDRQPHIRIVCEIGVCFGCKASRRNDGGKPHQADRGSAKGVRSIGFCRRVDGRSHRAGRAHPRRPLSWLRRQEGTAGRRRRSSRWRDGRARTTGGSDCGKPMGKAPGCG